MLEPFVSGRIAGTLDRLAILPEEFGTFPLGKLPEDHLRIARILIMDRLCGHVIEFTPRV